MKKMLQATLMSLCLLSTGYVWAHAHPKSEVPGEGSIVISVSDITITFDDALEPALSTLSVSDAQGKLVTNTKAELDTATHKTLHVNVPSLVSGVYLVKWVAVSLDGHRTSGAYHFTVK